MPTAIVLGAGMVGSVIAADLAGDFDVTVADASDDALARAKRRAGDVDCVRRDLSDPNAVAKLVEPYDVVLGAMPSRFGFATLRAVVGAGKRYADISFMPENALALDDVARANGATAVVDCGVAPGMSNMLAGYGAATLDEPERIVIYVGGLPRERHWPYEYKAGFAPSDVIEEYTRPARIVINGKTVVREALSEPELIDFDGVGTVEAFNTDGLRTLIDTLDVPDMIEKTMRYPGHIELMRVLRETGFFSHEPVDVGGVAVRPIDFTSRILFPHWTYEEGEADLTIMRVEVTGRRDGRRVTWRWDLHDRLDPATNTTSMARTTGFPCAIVARMLAAGEVTETGVLAPETFVRAPGRLDAVLKGLQMRGVEYTFEVRPES